MKTKQSADPGKILIDCQTCGAMFPVDDFRNDELSEVTYSCYELHRICPFCELQQESFKINEEIRKKQMEMEEKLPELLEQSGIEYYYSHDRTTGKIFREPPCRYLAEWIYRNRNSNLLISGITGCGKSTSASFIATRMIREGKNVCYTTLRKLLSDWRAAKTSDRDYATEMMLQAIFTKDLFIIDEIVGKAKISESGQELLFEIIESVNSGVCRSKIWLLGNFYTGSIEEIFTDSDPIRRRLHENFTCITADKSNKKITNLTVWKE